MSREVSISRCPTSFCEISESFFAPKFWKTSLTAASTLNSEGEQIGRSGAARSGHPSKTGRLSVVIGLEYIDRLTMFTIGGKDRKGIGICFK
jgi:hypothetical protein